MNFKVGLRAWANDAYSALIWAALLLVALSALSGAVYGLYLAVAQFGSLLTRAFLVIFILIFLIMRGICWLTGASSRNGVVEAMQIILQEARE